MGNAGVETMPKTTLTRDGGGAHKKNKEKLAATCVYQAMYAEVYVIRADAKHIIEVQITFAKLICFGTDVLIRPA